MKCLTLFFIFFSVNSVYATSNKMIEQVKNSYENLSKNAPSEAERNHYQSILDTCFTKDYKKIAVSEVKKCSQDQSKKYCDTPSRSASAFCVKIKNSRNRKRPTKRK